MLRLTAVPLIVATLLADTQPSASRHSLALALFVAAALTDRLDGVLARRTGTVSRFGIVVDPIADKALILGVFAAVAVLRELSWWVVAVVAARELVVTAARLWALRAGRLMPATTGGKTKTVLQVITAGVLLLPRPGGPGGWVTLSVTALVAVMVAVTMITGAQILVAAVRAPAVTPGRPGP